MAKDRVLLLAPITAYQTADLRSNGMAWEQTSQPSGQVLVEKENHFDTAARRRI